MACHKKNKTRNIRKVLLRAVIFEFKFAPTTQRQMDTIIQQYASSTDKAGVMHEFEVRFEGYHGDVLSLSNYQNVLRRLARAGFKLSANQKLLRVMVGDARIELKGLLAIQDYGNRDVFDDIGVVRKARAKPPVPSDYGFRLTLSTETEVPPDEVVALKGSWASDMKKFRFMHRIRMTHPGFPEFAVDCSTVQMSATPSERFSTSDVHGRPKLYEVEIEALNRPGDGFKSRLVKLCTIIAGGIQNTPYPIPNAEITAVLAAYSKLVRNDGDKIPLAQKFIGPNCVTLQHSNISRIKRGAQKALPEDDEIAFDDNPYSVHAKYVVTDKADGLRKLLFVNSGKVYFLTSKLQVEFTGATCKELPQTLLDGEFVERDKDGKDLNLFAVFDAYYVKGEDVRARSFTERRKRVESVVATLLPEFKYLLAAKTFFTDANIFVACRNCLSAVMPYHTDGLIFAPEEFGVGLTPTVKTLATKTTTWDMNFKWKPPSQNTIDFKIGIRDDLLTLSVSGTALNWDNAYEAILKQEGTCPRTAPGLRLFITEEDPASYLTSVVRGPDGTRRTLDGGIIETGMIIECSYDATKPMYWKWTPLRQRPDKDFPNSFATAQNNWQTIQRPITEAMITGDVDVDDARYYVSNKTAMHAIRNFHRWIKRMLLLKYAKSGENLVDFAVGMAGDLHSWREAKLAFVFGLDISADNIHNQKDGACMRYLTTTKKNSSLYAIFVEGDATKPVKTGEACAKALDKTVTRAIFGQGARKEVDAYRNVSLHYNTKFQVASMMFAVHYMFSTPRTLMQFIKNVADCLEEGGRFVGTAWDGSRVFELLKDTAVGEMRELNDVSIVRQYAQETFPATVASLGYGIDVSQSTFNQNREYLVHFGFFQDVMQKCGFTRISMHHFDSVYSDYAATNLELNASEQELSFKNMYFVFQKTSTVDIDVEQAKFRVERVGQIRI